MKKNCYLLFVLLLTGVSCSTVGNGIRPPVYDTSLDKALVARIKRAVYEVVVPKPEGNKIAYEKPLPLDQIPYAIRTDKYYSIGTAFAIGPNKFVSAAHVMNLQINSQFKPIYLRDGEGNVYVIDKILKYSTHRDFVVFSIRGKKPAEFMETNDRPGINEKVFAVGNALGQGIVIRDGLYTSDTPEEEEGEWKWIRFSAAASPGNSGGPLLDKDGKAIGIVLRKSANENLNYALPLSEVLKAPKNMAVTHMKINYLLDNMDMTKTGTLDKKFPLPKSYDKLKRELVEATNDFTVKLLGKLLNEHKENIFPRGEGSTQLLNSTIEAVFPHLVMKESDGNWSAFYPKELNEADLGNNGYLRYGSIGSTLFVYLRKPDDVPLQKLYNNTQLFMDMLLKGIYLYREIGAQKIKITSLGEANDNYSYVDDYKRKWLVRTWLLDFSDQKIAAFILPVPGGAVAMVRQAQTGVMDVGHIPDLRVFTNFIYLSYYGTLKEWRDFYKVKSLLPPVFSSIKIEAEYGKYLKYKSKRLAFSYTSSEMDISDKSYVQLSFGYFKDAGKTVWDVANIYAGEDKNNDTYFYVSRNIKPAKSLNDNFQSTWENVVKRKFPYNASPFYDDNGTYISSVHPGRKSSKKSGRKNKNVLYAVWHKRDGKAEESLMEDRLNKFVKNLTVYE